LNRDVLPWKDRGLEFGDVTLSRAKGLPDSSPSQKDQNDILSLGDSGLKKFNPFALSLSKGGSDQKIPFMVRQAHHER